MIEACMGISYYCSKEIHFPYRGQPDLEILYEVQEFEVFQNFTKEPFN